MRVHGFPRSKVPLSCVVARSSPEAIKRLLLVWPRQLGPSTVSQEFRGKVSDQLSMHFQLLVQTGVLATKVRSDRLIAGESCVV